MHCYRTFFYNFIWSFNVFIICLLDLQCFCFGSSHFLYRCSTRSGIVWHRSWFFSSGTELHHGTFTKSLTNCFRLLGSRARLWCSNPPSLQREADCGSREGARWAATGCGEPDVSLPLSSAPVQSALTIQAVVEHLWNQSVCTIVLTANDFL